MSYHPLREKTPKRRKNRSVCKKYTSYRKTLRADFHDRCGYCASFDKIRSKSFAIDHFVPQNPDGWSHSLRDNDYYNLVYSCGNCNSSKSNKWPTKNENIHNDGVQGFVDPTSANYENLFQRDSDGFIIQKTSSDQLSKYILTELSLNMPVHSILWKLERLDNSIESTSSKLSTSPNVDLKALHYQLLEQYHQLVNELFSIGR